MRKSNVPHSTAGHHYTIDLMPLRKIYCIIVKVGIQFIKSCIKNVFKCSEIMRLITIQNCNCCPALEIILTAETHADWKWQPHSFLSQGCDSRFLSTWLSRFSLHLKATAASSRFTPAFSAGRSGKSLPQSRWGKTVNIWQNIME